MGGTANPDIVFYGSFLTRLADASSVRLRINLDHGGSYEEVMSALRAGFTSIMVNRSVLPYEENVKEVSEIVKIAHAMGVSVEAELGHVGQGDNYAVDGKTALTDPEEAKKYIEETGVDMLAVAIGTAHGAYVGTPKIHFDRLQEIKKVTGDFPLALHGGSRFQGDENLRKVCQMGINKVNVCNDLMRAACDTVTAADLSGNGAYGLWGLIQKGWKAHSERAHRSIRWRWQSLEGRAQRHAQDRRDQPGREISQPKRQTTGVGISYAGFYLRPCRARL